MVTDNPTDDNQRQSRQDKFFQAAKEGNIQKLERLLNKDTRLIRAQNQEGITPLVIAAHKGKLDALTWLREKGASLEDKDNYGNSVFLIAAMGGHTNILGYLMNETNNSCLLEKNDYGESPWLQAAYNGHIEAVQLLTNKLIETFFERPCDHNEKSNIFFDIIQIAAHGGYPEIVEWAYAKLDPMAKYISVSTTELQSRLQKTRDIVQAAKNAVQSALETEGQFEIEYQGLKEDFDEITELLTTPKEELERRLNGVIASQQFLQGQQREQPAPTTAQRKRPS